jgi:hypothetical protein
VILRFAIEISDGICNCDWDLKLRFERLRSRPVTNDRAASAGKNLTLLPKRVVLVKVNFAAARRFSISLKNLLLIHLNPGLGTEPLLLKSSSSFSSRLENALS